MKAREMNDLSLFFCPFFSGEVPRSIWVFNDTDKRRIRAFIASVLWRSAEVKRSQMKLHSKPMQARRHWVVVRRPSP